LLYYGTTDTLRVSYNSYADEASLGKDASKQERKIQDINVDEGITFVNETAENQGRFNDQEDADMLFDVTDDLRGEEVFVAKQNENVVEKEVDDAQVQVNTATITPTILIDEVTLAQALAELKHTKCKAEAKGIVFHELEESTTTTTTIILKSKSQDTGKAIMIEEHVKLKKKDQIMLDEEVALKLQAELQAEFGKEKRLAREKAQKEEEEANNALIETRDDVQAKVDADYQLAERLQAEEQQELNDVEKATLFMQLLEKRRKFFAAKRAEEKRNRPPTRAQQRSIMCTYLKNIKGWKHNSLKNKTLANIQELFDKAMKRVNTFVDYKTELVEESFKKAKAKVIEQGSSKRAGTELEQENKKGVVIDAIPLAVKPPSIVDWKIHKEGKKSYYQIIKTGESSKLYLVFSHMLKNFDREDVETLWKLVKAKHGSTRLEEGYERVLWGDLKVMFDPHVEDEAWKMQQRYNVVRWTLFNSCGVHCLSLQSGHIYMLVEKRYPLTPAIITYMLNKKLHADYFDEMTYQLFNLSQNILRVNKVFGSILLVMVKLLMKKLDDFGEEYQV
nr:hypothetical protein [Tanacetum cinerariifolium]